MPSPHSRPKQSGFRSGSLRNKNEHLRKRTPLHEMSVRFLCSTGVLHASRGSGDGWRRIMLVCKSAKGCDDDRVRCCTMLDD